METPRKNFALAGSVDELKAKGRLVLHGAHRPILVLYDRGRISALDNRCPHMGFPLERGSNVSLGTTLVSILKVAARSICGPTTCRPAQLRFAMETCG